MNNTNLIGRITKDLELKKGKNGKNYLSFTVAINEYSNGKETTDYIPCVAFDKTAENMKNNLKKGAKVGITGRLNNSGMYTDANGERKTSITRLVVTSVEFLDAKQAPVADSADANKTDSNDLSIDEILDIK